MSKGKYFFKIDIVRILAAFAVASTFHYGIVLSGHPLPSNYIIDILYNYSGFVTELFFIISGFLLCETSEEKIVEKKISFFDFIYKKMKRLYLLMLVSVLAVAIAQRINYKVFLEYAVFNDSGDGKGLLALVLSLLGVNSGWVCDMTEQSINGPTWYLSVLMICFVIYFFLTWIFANAHNLRIISYAMLVVLGLCLYIHPIRIPLLFYSCGRGYLNFFIGVLVSESMKKWKLLRETKVCAAIGVLMLMVFFVLKRTRELQYISIVFSLLVCGGVFLIAISSCDIKEGAAIRIVQYLGKISFGIYLWNIPTFAWIKLIDNLFDLKLDFNSFVIWLIVMGANVLLAILSYELIEKNIYRKVAVKEEVSKE